MRDPLTGPDTIPVECYGQGETQKISEQAQADPSALLRYLDRFTKVLQAMADEESLRERRVAGDSRDSRDSRAHVSLIPQYERELSITRQQIRKFAEGNAKQLIESYQQIEGERQARRNVIEQARAVSLPISTMRRPRLRSYSSNQPRTRASSSSAVKSLPRLRRRPSSSRTTCQHPRPTFAHDRPHWERWSRPRWMSGHARKQLSSPPSMGSGPRSRRRGSRSIPPTSPNSHRTRRLTSVVGANLKTWEPYLARQLAEKVDLSEKRWAARKAVYERRRAFATSATKKLAKHCLTSMFRSNSKRAPTLRQHMTSL